MPHDPKIKRTAYLLLFLYTLIMFWGLYFKFGIMDWVRHNHNFMHDLTLTERLMYRLIPFQVSGRTAIEEYLFNLIALAPYGVLLPLAQGRVRVLPQTLVCFLISLSVEITQLFTVIGGYATDDLIANTAAYFVGLLFYALVIRRLRDERLLSVLRFCVIVVGAVVLFAAVQTAVLWPQYYEMMTCRQS